MPHAETEYHDGKLLPMDAIAVNPLCIEDLTELVAHVPADLAIELARLAVWQAQGNELPPPKGFMR